MPKPTTVYVCTNCDSQFPKWAGRCTECGQWGTLVAQAGDVKRPGRVTDQPASSPVRLHELGSKPVTRVAVGMSEADRVFGGGLVPGSLILLGGDPGIGKSTLALQCAARLSLAKQSVLYVSGEESGDQVAMRLNRLGAGTAPIDFLATTSLETVIATATKQKPNFLIIDSVQTIASDELPGEAGSVQQVRVATIRLMELAKKTGLTVILVGHVTKEGSMAGPKALEHLVDVVLYLEGDPLGPHRLLRAVKNRFGSTNEVGVFDMIDTGLVEVADPSRVFLSERQSAPGAAATVILEGSRPFVIEVQALVNPTVFGMPRRTASGVDFNRLQVLTAVLSKRGGLKLASQDIFVNVVSGLKVQERAADLAISMAIASATSDRTVPSDMIVLGEVGLGGEVRRVPQLERRLAEAAQIGFKQACVPVTTGIKPPKGLLLKQVQTMREALALLQPAKK